MGLCVLWVCGMVLTNMEKSISEIKEIHIIWEHLEHHLWLLKMKTQTDDT